MKTEKSNKRNRRIIFSVSAVTLAFFIIAGIFLFEFQVSLESRDFSTYTDNQYHSLESIITSYKDENREDTDNTFHREAECEYPAVFALFDENGEILADSRPAFIIDYVGKDSKVEYPATIIADAWSCASAETRKAIIEFVKSCRRGCRLCGETISLCKKGDEYIPVSAVLYNNFNSEDGKITVKFTDEKPTLTVTCSAENFITLYGYNHINSDMKAKYLNKLTARLEAFEKDFAKTHEGSEFSSGGGILNYNWRQYETHTKRNGRGLCLYYDAEYDLNYRALTGGNFAYMLSDMGLFFIIFAAVLCAVLVMLNNKNERITKSREAFVAAAAHELKTPLAVITNNCECILEEVSPEKNGEYINGIYSESRRMTKMVKTLLQYNKLRTDSAPEMKNENLCEIITEQAKKYKALTEANELTFSEELVENLTLKCNKELLGLAIENYISNAVKFCPCGGEIKIAAGKVGGKVRVTVFNSGSSVSNEDKEHIFEELYCGDKSRQRTDGSAGMGLAICRLVFEIHKFDYGFKNTENGVEFYFAEK